MAGVAWAQVGGGSTHSTCCCLKTLLRMARRPMALPPCNGSRRRPDDDGATRCRAMAGPHRRDFGSCSRARSLPGLGRPAATSVGSQPLERFTIPRRRLTNDFLRQRRRRRCLVPRLRLEPIAHELLVEARRVAARPRAFVARPARNATNRASALRPSARAWPASSGPNSNLVSAMIEAARLGDTRRLRGRARGSVRAPAPRVLGADQLDRALERDVLVVLAGRRFRRGREDRLRRAGSRCSSPPAAARRRPSASAGIRSSRCRPDSRAPPLRSATASAACTTIARPSICSRFVLQRRPSSGRRRSGGSGTIARACRTRTAPCAVSNAPLPGIGSAMTTSNALQAIAGDHQQPVVANRVVVAHLAAGQQRQALQKRGVQRLGHDSVVTWKCSKKRGGALTRRRIGGSQPPSLKRGTNKAPPGRGLCRSKCGDATQWRPSTLRVRPPSASQRAARRLRTRQQRGRRLLAVEREPDQHRHQRRKHQKTQLIARADRVGRHGAEPGLRRRCGT